MYVPDNYDAFEAHQAEQDRAYKKWLAQLPRCSNCNKKIKDESAVRICSVGGEALMEGIMMKGPEKSAMAVRKPNGEIDLSVWDTKKLTGIRKVPFIRGTFNFIDTLIQGYDCLMKSAEISGQEEEPDKLELWLNKVFGKAAGAVFGTVVTILAAVLAVAQLTALSVFPLFRKKFSRKQLYTGSMIAVAVSYIIFFLSFEWLPLIVIAGLGLFFAQAFIQLLMLLFLADAVEYGEWKLGKRNEAASFAVQPFINQFGGAASKGVVSFTLIISGINRIVNAAGENAAKIIGETPSAIWIMKISMMILPLICILIGFVLYIKKFKIDEQTYAKILEDLKAREEQGKTDEV